MSQASFDNLMALAEEIGRIIGGLRASVEKQRKEGLKNKEDLE